MRKFCSFNLTEILVLAGVFFADRITKYIICSFPSDYSKRIFSFFYITYVENTGAAFGIGKNLNIFFIFITILLMGVLLYYKNYLAASGLKAKIATIFILGGALGNLYDRIFYGKVIDFLDFRIWPVFNIADSFITIGGLLLALSFLKKENKEE